MAVGVCLEYGHEMRGLRHKALQIACIGKQCAGIYFHPGPGGVGYLLRPDAAPDPQYDRAGGGAAQADGDIVAQAVFHKDAPQPQHPCRAANNDDDSRVQYVYEQREAAERHLNRALPAGEQGKEKIHDGGQEHIHAVVPLPALRSGIERLGEHEGKAHNKARNFKTCSAWFGISQLSSQPHEDGSKEEAAACVAHESKQTVVNAADYGDVFDKAPVTVTQQAEQVEYCHRGQACPTAQPAHEHPCQPGAEYGGREIPEMVERALEEHLLHKIDHVPALQMPGIYVDRQVQRRAGSVDYGSLLQETAHIRSLGEYKKARDHEEKRHGHARYDAGEDEIGRL